MASTSAGTAMSRPNPHHHQVRSAHRSTCARAGRSEEHTSELQSRSDLVCRLLLEKKKRRTMHSHHFLSSARTELVNGLCNEFLAGATLALKQYSNGVRRHVLHPLEHLLHRPRPAD